MPLQSFEPAGSAGVSTAERAQGLAGLLSSFLGHEGVLATGARHQRLVQMPAAGKNVRQLRPAHEGRVIAVAARDLLHRRTEQHHGVGRGKAHSGREGEFALARAELDLDRAQRQPEREDVAADDLERRLHLIVALLGEILIAVR